MSDLIKSVRGMHDVLPPQSFAWQSLERTIAEVFSAYGYGEIRTPLLEVTELFSRSIGEVTDIVEKEMYSFEDRNGISLSLRPEGTASCVRAGLEHGLLDGRQMRLWYLGPMFRHERPQKGRYRQFHQAGAEAYGMAGPDLDAELIAMTARLWRRLDLRNLRLEINTLGDPDMRAAYRGKLVDYLKSHFDSLDEDSRRRLETNPLRILDSKNPAMRGMLDAAPRLLDSIGGEAREHFEALQERLNWLGIDHIVNPRLVRGLDYYGRTVFEWVSEELGAQGTVCAGGRYDALIGQLGGRTASAAGFAMGLERLLSLMESQGAAVVRDPHAYCVAVGEGAEQAMLVLTERIRDADPGIRIVLNCGGGSFKAQMKRADRSGAALALILGEDEITDRSVTVKFLRGERPQQNLRQSELTAQKLVALVGVSNG